jgi:hypothetical protein
MELEAAKGSRTIFGMPFSQTIKSDALVACRRTCCICHTFCGINIECHHIVPEAQGGPSTLDNCIPICFNCHADVEHYNPAHPKGNKFSPEELRKHRDRWFAKVAATPPSTNAEPNNSGGSVVKDIRASETPRFARTGKRLVEILGWEITDEQLAQTKKEFDELLTRLKNLTPHSRRFLAIIVQQTQITSNRLDAVSVAEIEDATGLAEDVVIQQLHILDGHGFIQGDSGTIILRHWSNGWKVYDGLRKFCEKTGTSFESLIVDLDFSSFD